MGLFAEIYNIWTYSELLVYVELKVDIIYLKLMGHSILHYAVNGSIKKLSLIYCANIYLFSIFFSVDFSIDCANISPFSTDFVRWKSAG